MKCERCGVQVPDGQKICGNCGMRVAGEVNEEEVAELHVRGDVGEGRPVESESGRMLCSRCHQSFHVSQLVEQDGQYFCDDCLSMLSRNPQERAVEWDVAGRDEAPPRGSWVQGLVHLLIMAAVAAGLGYGAWYVFTGQGELPLPPVVDEDMDLTGETAKKAPEVAKAKDYPPVMVPHLAGAEEVKCPVCGASVLISSGRSEVVCPECGRKLRPRPCIEFLDLKYVAKKGEKAVFELKGKMILGECGNEILEGSGIWLESFEPDGVVISRKRTVRFEDHRPGHEGEREVTIKLEKRIPKARIHPPKPVTVLRGTKSIRCDGREGDKVYHSDPVDIPLHITTPGTYLISCIRPECWKSFRVTIKDFPLIRLPVSFDSDQVRCPVCGYKRLLAAAGEITQFRCVGCDRKIELYRWRPRTFSFLGVKNGKAVVIKSRKQYLSRPGEELWPGAGIVNDGTGTENGRDYLDVKHIETINFTDYRSSPPAKMSLKLPVRMRVYRRQTK